MGFDLNIPDPRETREKINPEQEAQRLVKKYYNKSGF